MEPIFTIYAGDTSPSISADLTTDDGSGNQVPLDLTDQEVTFLMWREGSSEVAVSGTAHAVGDPTEGRAQYDWLPGDTARAGAYVAIWRVQDGTQVLTSPNDGVPIPVHIRQGATS